MAPAAATTPQTTIERTGPDHVPPPSPGPPVSVTGRSRAPLGRTASAVPPPAGAFINTAVLAPVADDLGPIASASHSARKRSFMVVVVRTFNGGRQSPVASWPLAAMAPKH